MGKNRVSDRQSAVRPLPQAEQGRVWRVVEVSGADDEQRRRLVELGFVAGTPVEVLQTHRRGTVVIRLGGTKLAMASAVADHIRVH